MRISNTRILEELGRHIYIDPPPKLEDFDAAGFNLHLGAELIIWPGDVPYVIDHRAEHISKAWERHGKRHNLLSDGPYHLRPRELCLGFTREHIRLPIGDRSFQGFLSNRSWAGRSFIRSAVDAFEVKPGTDNHVTLEIVSEMDILLYEGMPFIQIGFEQVDGPIFATNGWVHGQTTPSGGQKPRTAEFSDEIRALHEAAKQRLSS